MQLRCAYIVGFGMYTRSKEIYNDIYIEMTRHRTRTDSQNHFRVPELGLPCTSFSFICYRSIRLTQVSAAKLRMSVGLPSDEKDYFEPYRSVCTKELDPV